VPGHGPIAAGTAVEPVRLSRDLLVALVAPAGLEEIAIFTAAEDVVAPAANETVPALGADQLLGTTAIFKPVRASLSEGDSEAAERLQVVGAEAAPDTGIVPGDQEMIGAAAAIRRPRSGRSSIRLRR